MQPRRVPIGPSVAARLPPQARILVVDLGFLGDTVHLIPALHDLRLNHPKGTLDVVTTPVGGQVLGMIRSIDRIWTQPLGKPSPPWWRHLDLQWHLWRRHYDVCINFSGADRTLFVGAFSGARLRVTRASRQFAFWQRQLAGELLPAPSRSLPVYEQRRQCLATAGFRLGEARFDLDIPAPAASWVTDRFPEGAIHVSISASTPFKEWPIDHWAQLCGALVAATQLPVIATSSNTPRERSRVAELRRRVANPLLVVPEEALSLEHLFALLARCRIHAGTDSGVTHVAWALGLPTVTIYRDYPGLSEWRPTGSHHRTFTAPCSCAHAREPSSECQSAGGALCLSRVTPAAILEAVLQALPP